MGGRYTAAMSRGIYPNESARLKDVAQRCFPDNLEMRKGDELVQAKGIVDLPPEIEKSIAKYCIQDVDLTYSIFKQFIVNYPQSELDVIDLTCRMFVEPKIVLNQEMLIKHKAAVILDTKTKIENSGLTREILASQAKFARHLTEELKLVIPTKKSLRTGKMIPAFSKSDPGYVQMCAAHPEFTLKGSYNL